MAKDGIKRKLPKRTGKAQKVRMMQQCHSRLGAKKDARRAENARRATLNASLISDHGWPFYTVTERRNWLREVKAARRATFSHS